MIQQFLLYNFYKNELDCLTAKVFEVCECKIILEAKIQKEKFDEHEVLKYFNFKESRNSKYCNEINLLKEKYNC